MKVAIPTRNNLIDDNIWQCEYYTIFSINCGLIFKEEILTLPEDCKNNETISLSLAQEGVNVMLIGKICNEEIDILNFNGIEVFYNCSGNVKDIINNYLDGKLSDQDWKNQGFCRTSKN